MKNYKITEYIDRFDIMGKPIIFYAVYRRYWIFFWECLSIHRSLEDAKVKVEYDKEYRFGEEKVKGYF